MERVLVIEDSKLMRLTIVDTLKRIGFNDIIELNDANLIFKHPAMYLKNVKFIISDIRLPGINGIELAKKINNEPKYNNIPIIFLTAYSGADTVEEAIKAGAIDFIKKPITEDVLEARIKRILSISKEKRAQDLTYINKEEGKEKIDIEYQRAVRGNQETSFSIIEVNDEDIEKCQKEMKSILRKIDIVYIVDNKQILIIMPLTGAEGMDVVMDRIYKKLDSEKIQILNKEVATYDPRSKSTLEIIFKKLGL